MLRRLAAQGISHSFKSFRIVSPGNKISEWFDIQSEGDSLTVELFPPDRESEWIGIMFCVVFPPPKYSASSGLGIRVECLSPGINSICSDLWPKSDLRGDHLWVFFVSHFEIWDTKGGHMNFSFHALSSDIKVLETRLPMKRCGARMLYEQDLKDLFNKLKWSREYCEKEKDLSGSSIKDSLLKRHKP